MIRGIDPGKILGIRYSGHRLAWLMVYGRWPNEMIDHINGDRSDNRIENLREISAAENHYNLGVPKSNKSGCVGVYRSKEGNWCAEITKHSKKVHLGTFASLLEAAEARKAAEREYGFHKNHGARPSHIAQTNASSG